jgi:nickel transport protein
VNIFAYVEGDTVYTESYFPDGRKVEGGIIEVYDSQGNKLLGGITDKNGQFNFKPPIRDDLKIVLIASMGHKNSYTISKGEFSEGRGEQEAESRRQNEERHKGVEQVDLAKLKQIIDASLDEKLKPIIKELKKQKEVSFYEIIAGIGYIFGIFGLIMYFISKRTHLKPK